jgi:Na+-transporting NADH:ubiquinone oxidoreductase subunit F
MNLVLMATLVACGLMTVLAVLLIVAERYLVNYGECEIDINDGGKDVTVTGGDNLLMSLRNGGVYLASACGGRGTCAYCKCKILEGGGPVGPTEAPLLSEEEIADDVRISCQVKVREDMKIAVPEELLLVKEFRAKVERIRDLTHDIKELRLELIEPETIEFTPGHYVQLEAPPYGDNKQTVFRAYSISSPPSDNRHIELIVRLVPGGICTTYVFEHLSEGDEVSFTGPYGEFRMSDTDAEMIWIAGGSGMAPFWSMVRHMKENNIQRKCRYFFGAVNKRDLFFLDELGALSEEMPNFRFIPALSGSGEGVEGWEGDTGLITEVVGSHVEDGENKEGYLCGSPGMCDAAVKVLYEKGVTEDKVYFDKFA